MAPRVTRRLLRDGRCDSVMGTIFETAPEDAARLLDEALDGDRTWSDDELASVLRHQLSASLRSDLFETYSDESVATDSISEHRAFVEGSYRDLLSHVDPPVALLRVVKDWAKACRSRDKGLIPTDIATVLYYAAIAAGRVRLGENISSMSDKSLKKGFGWALSRPWLDGHLRALFSASIADLAG